MQESTAGSAPADCPNVDAECTADCILFVVCVQGLEASLASSQLEVEDLRHRVAELEAARSAAEEDAAAAKGKLQLERDNATVLEKARKAAVEVRGSWRAAPLDFAPRFCTRRFLEAARHVAREAKRPLHAPVSECDAAARGASFSGCAVATGLAALCCGAGHEVGAGKRTRPAVPAGRGGGGEEGGGGAAGVCR
jgi:hypothetical protein